MTLEEVWEYAENGKTVFYIGCFMFQYHVFPAIIVGIRSSGKDTIPEAEVDNLVLSKKETIPICYLYTDESEAHEKCKNQQKEQGYVVITQKEYDELIALKGSVSK